MDKQADDLDEDVVVIEQRDKRTYIYIGLAALLGIAIGGLIGGVVAGKHFRQTYQSLESHYHQLEEKNQQDMQASEQKEKLKIQQLKKEFDQKLADEKEDYEKKFALNQAQLAALKQEKETLEAELTSQKKQLSTITQQNDKLSHQTNIQTSLFERSRELFQREFKVKQALEALQKEKDELIKKEKALKKECNQYLDGTSWDAHSDACNQQDAANQRLGKVDQLIRVNQMDLKQIQAIADELGVD